MDPLVFISYSSSDKIAAEACCAALEAAGHKCWMAPRDIEPGADYPTAILDGLHHAGAVVLIVSPGAVASPHILSEVAHAFGKMPIIPFRLSPTSLPANFDYFLSLSQWLDAKEGCTTQNLARLAEAVSQALAGKSIESPGRKAGVSKRFLLAGALLLMAIGSAAYFLRPAAKDTVVTKKDIAGVVTAPPVEDKASKVTETRPQPWVNPKDGLTYVWVPPGSFTMGCSPGDTQCRPDEGPDHFVELPNGFRMGQTEVTNAAYRRVVPSAEFNPSEQRLPAVGLSWRNAKAYCAEVGGRLPTEAEWEYAARGGVPGAYYGVPSKIAWYAGDVRHEVAAKEPNAYGLYDMLGNASEWVLDRYYNKYDIDAPAIGKVERPLAPNASAVTRGGFWESEVADIRVSRRVATENDVAIPMAGVRCVIERQ